MFTVSAGVTKGTTLTIKSTQSAPAATASSNMEPDNNNTSHVDAENTSPNWGDQDNSSDPQDQHSAISERETVNSGNPRGKLRGTDQTT